MQNAWTLIVTTLSMSMAVSACGTLTATEEPNAVTAATTPTRIPASSPTPTTAPLQLEILQSQTWTDNLANARVNVLFRNPYEFLVSPKFGARTSLFHSAGEFIRDDKLYFLDGISGGTGFLVPGERIAANACFTCEEAPLTEDWAEIKFVAIVEDTTGK